PWGPRQPEPFFDHQTRIYQLALTPGLRSPFQPDDELHSDDAKPADPKPAAAKSEAAKSDTPKPADAPKTPPIQITLVGLAGRIRVLPVPAGNYSDLSVNGSRLFWVRSESAPGSTPALMGLDIGHEKIVPKLLVDGIQGYGLTPDGKNLLLHKGGDFYVLSAAGLLSLDDAKVDLSAWAFSITPREEWRQMLVEAWRLERDYFYDRNMNGVDWPATLQRYLPLCDRVRDRAELNDLLGQMISDLSALHMFVYGGDIRQGSDQIAPGSLGAALVRDEAHGGFRVERLYHGDPDDPEHQSPLALPGVDVAEGDVITTINGVDTLSVPDPAVLLRRQAGQQVLLHVWEKATHRLRDVVVTPINSGQERDLQYTDWEVSRRQKTEMAGNGTIGYVHLRAMGADDIAQWARDFYPVFDRAGLIIDVRHNNGGNIDSWLLEKLMRKAWFFWQPRIGAPSWNMQWAFRGHVVVLCDEWTASDGEAFTEGFRRLGLGKVIGTRTWGGEIWLSSDNGLVDNGIATAAETGVYGEESKWLIEGHGVDPDIVVDNRPHATFEGQDAQLDAAIAYLKGEIRLHPVPVPPAPAYPDKSGRPPHPAAIIKGG
ncbi:MAG: S41 family peptidase, partial [Armatimonadota bacterium]|nr:S41 family peptidase [Armatimonadota bacterium]